MAPRASGERQGQATNWQNRLTKTKTPRGTRRTPKQGAMSHGTPKHQQSQATCRIATNQANMHKILYPMYHVHVPRVNTNTNPQLN